MRMPWAYACARGHLRDFVCGWALSVRQGEQFARRFRDAEPGKSVGQVVVNGLAGLFTLAIQRMPCQSHSLRGKLTKRVQFWSHNVPRTAAGYYTSVEGIELCEGGFEALKRLTPAFHEACRT